MHAYRKDYGCPITLALASMVTNYTDLATDECFFFLIEIHIDVLPMNNLSLVLEV